MEPQLSRHPLVDVFDGASEPYSGTILSLRDVSVRFGGIAAVIGLGLDVDQHEIVAMIGPNGAGKSTALNAISRIVRSTGDIRFCGRSLPEPGPRVPAMGV